VLTPKQSLEEGEEGRSRSPILRWIKLILVLALLTLLAGGTWFYRTQEQQLRGRVEQELVAITRLKVNQIAEWRANQLAEADELTASPYFAEGVARWLAAAHSESPEEILDRFGSLQKHYHYEDVLLVAPDGQILLSLSGAYGKGHIEILKDLDAALREGKPALTDLHICEVDPKPHISVITPILRENGPDQNPLGAVIMVSDARQFLYPLIQTWPTPSRTAETLLVRREGDHVLFLNELRHQPGTALRLRIPLSRTDVPAVMAVLGKKGIVVGKDYRGIDVLSAAIPIPDSPWFMVAKVDTTEAFAEWRSHSVLIIGPLLGMVLLGGTGGLIAWQRNEKAHFRGLYQSEAARRAIEERHGITLKSIGDAVIVTDAEGRVELLNPVAEALTGWTNDDARLKPLDEVFHAVKEETRQPVENPVARVIREKTVVSFGNHTVLIARDGMEHYIADSGSRICDEQGKFTGMVLVFRDQSEEREAQRTLQERERKFRETVTFLDEGYYSTTMDGIILEHNPAFNRILGFEPTQDLRGTALPFFWQNPNDRKEYLDELMAKGFIRNYLINAKTIREERIVSMANAHLERDENGTPVGIEGTIADLTEFKREEERFKVAAESLSDVIYEWDLAERVDWFGNIDGMLGYELGKFPRTMAGWAETLHPNDRERVMAAVNRHLRGEAPYDVEYRIRKKDGDYSYWHARGRAILDSAGNAVRWVGAITDITERKRAEDALRASERNLSLRNAISQVFLTVPSEEMYSEVLKVILEAMHSPYGVFGYIDEEGANVVPSMTRDIWDKCQVPEKSIVFPRQTWGDSSWPRAIREKKPNYSNQISELVPEGHIAIRRHMSLPILFHGDVIGLLQVANKETDYTDNDLRLLELISSIIAPVLDARLKRDRQDAARQRALADLERSNKDLEQFAYVASHDLQEPLRTVSSYTQLLAKRYAGRLDQDAHDFINYAVEGANRMQRLIQDLLAYARITTRGGIFAPLDLHEALGEAIANLQTTIQESAAVVTNDELPTVNADHRQLVQVFQNLIGNGIKYRKEDEPPHIHIFADRTGREWIISVKDNGIGIDPQYFNRLFIVFQRLHGKQEYSGNGIGLALCKRIVVRHGGRIWVESALGKGALFRFTIKA
jgi:PAS domain S-box-containing protein